MTDTQFACSNTLVDDPAVPGDPWSHLRYHYGQLLGAEDLTAEQRAFVLRHRLHLAVLHGAGTASGLRVTEKRPDAADPGFGLRVESGLAVDALGREIFVNVVQCLDLTELPKAPLWDELEPVDAPRAEDVPIGKWRRHGPAGASAPVDIESRPVGPLTRREGLAARLREGLRLALARGTAPDRYPGADLLGRLRRRRADAPPSGSGLTPPPLPGTKGLDIRQLHTRRGYVVLSYAACYSHEVPAITPPCGDETDARAFSRVTDRFRIDLVSTPPDDPHRFARQWLGHEDPIHHADRTLRDRLVAHTINDAPFSARKDIACQWLEPGSAPVLLAVVDIDVVEQEIIDLRVHNEVRPILPSTQVIAEQLFGQRLIGPDGRAPLKVSSVVVSKVEGGADNGKAKVGIEFTQPFELTTIGEDSLQVLKHDGAGWQALTHLAYRQNGGQLEVVLDDPFDATVTYQVHLRGDGPRPILGAGGPLSGWWDDPVPGRGRGRDVSLTKKWSER